MSVVVRGKNKTVPEKTVGRIRTLIARKYAVGDVLPTHRDLAVQLSVSHPSVAVALKVLAAQGLVNPVQRKGTVVIKRPSAKQAELSQIAVVAKGYLSTLFVGYRGQMLSGLGEKLDERDMNLTLFPHKKGEGGIAPIEEIERMADGIVLQGILSNKFISSCKSMGLPMVLLDNYAADAGVDCVVCDNFGAGHHVVNYLAELGHKRLVYVRQPMTISADSDNVERLQAFDNAVDELGLFCSGKFDVDSMGLDNNKEVIALIIDMLKSDENSPTAFVTSDDTTASWLISILQKAGYEVPRDISVIAIAQSSRVTLHGTSHISGCIMDFRDMGVKALETLERRCREFDAPPFLVRIGYEFTEGYTCKKV